MDKAAVALALCPVLGGTIGLYAMLGGWMIADLRFKVRALEEKIRRIEASSEG